MNPSEPTNGDALLPAARTPRRFGVWAMVLAVVATAAVTAGALLFFAGHWRASGNPVEQAAADAKVYHCPMHPSIVQDHPGTCPICGMKLVLVEKTDPDRAAKESESGASAGVSAEGQSVPGLGLVEIDPARQQLIGLTTAEATRGPIGGAWRTVGRVAIDETRVRHINVKVPGFVERIYVDFVGKKVRKGDPLFTIYSPDLLSAQEEYLLALRTRGALSTAGGRTSSDGDALVAAARRKLALWDVPESEIERIGRTREPTKTLTVYSPVSGVVTKKDVVEGMKLDAGAMPYEIVDLSSVWVLVDVYESELRFVNEHMAATLSLNAFPNRTFEGKVVFIDPLLDPRTRTVKARLTFPNSTGELRPEMFGEVVLLGAPREALRIPSDAVIDSGTAKVVFVAVGEGKFQPRIVELGSTDRTAVEVTSGLASGERVVTRANFLVDSESRLRASLAESAGSTTTTPETPKANEHRGHGR